MREEMADFRVQLRAGFARMSGEFDDMKKRFRGQEHHIMVLRHDQAIVSGQCTNLRHQIDVTLTRLKDLEDRAGY